VINSALSNRRKPTLHCHDAAVFDLDLIAGRIGEKFVWP
jgi:hypothetical protein